MPPLGVGPLVEVNTGQTVDNAQVTASVWSLLTDEASI